MFYYYKTLDQKGWMMSKKPFKEEGYIEITENEWRKHIDEIEALANPIPTQEDNIRKEITALKKELASTDYQALKYFEGWITSSEYAPIKMQRQTLRDRINELEAKLI